MIAAVESRCGDVKILKPPVRFQQGRRGLQRSLRSLCGELGVSRRRLRRAIAAGWQAQDDFDEEDLVVGTDTNKADDFERLENLGDGFKDFLNESGSFRIIKHTNEPDKKLEAMKNTAAPSQSLHEYLTEQWGLVDAKDSVKKAGSAIIDYIDDRGYLSVRLEQLHNKDKNEFTIDDLNEALELVQKLDPAGVGARDLKECLLIQMAQSSEDMSFETKLVADHMDDLLENRLPDIARKMKCTIEEINHAIERMSKLDTSPGLQIGQDRNHPVTADVIVDPSDDEDGYTVQLADFSLPALRISDYYAGIARKCKQE